MARDQEIDEEEIGKAKVGGSGISCRVSVTGRKRRFEKVVTAAASPGSAVRVSVVFGGQAGSRLRISSRLLAYIDAQTGKAIVRMGAYEVGEGESRGHEVGQQLVWESDTPVIEIK